MARSLSGELRRLIEEGLVKHGFDTTAKVSGIGDYTDSAHVTDEAWFNLRNTDIQAAFAVSYTHLRAHET